MTFEYDERAAITRYDYAGYCLTNAINYEVPRILRSAVRKAGKLRCYAEKEKNVRCKRDR